MTSDGQRSHGWRQMLNVYVARPLDTAIDRAGQNYYTGSTPIREEGRVGAGRARAISPTW